MTEAVLGCVTIPSTPPYRKPTIASVIAEVAQRHGLTASDLIGRSRLKHINDARQESMYEARRITQRSFPVLAVFFGRDWTTIRHGCIEHAKRMIPEGRD